MAAADPVPRSGPGGVQTNAPDAVVRGVRVRRVFLLGRSGWAPNQSAYLMAQPYDWEVGTLTGLPAKTSLTA